MISPFPRPDECCRNVPMPSSHRKLRVVLEALLSEARVKEEIVEKKIKKNALIFKITQEIRASGASHQEPGLEAKIPFL